MPRIAGVIFPGVPHHVTQRGNRKGQVFFNDEDRWAYLDLLRDYAERHTLEVLAYCLMTNHVHLVVLPRTADALPQALKPLHMRHAQRINRVHGWNGHLWQGRYFSSPLDEDYVWAAIRYVELNPVRSRMTERAENYPWSSAAAHCGADRVDDQHRERFAFDVFSDDEQRTARLRDALEQRQHFADVRDLLVVQPRAARCWRRS